MHIEKTTMDPNVNAITWAKNNFFMLEVIAIMLAFMMTREF